MNLTILTSGHQTSFLTLALTASLLAACSGGSSSDDREEEQATGINFDISANLIDNVVIPGYQDFANTTAGLESEISTYCNDVSNASQRAAAQDKWRAVSALWQTTQSYAVGPVAPTASNLTTRIYSSSPHTSGQDSFITTEADQLAADSSYTIPSNANKYTRGLDALEFLLFPADSVSTAEQTKRCNYAKLVAAEITANAQSVVEAWTANNNEGRNNFLEAQDSAGVTQITVFFELLVENVDKQIKDSKLGEPAKLKNDGPCDSHSCPELVENNIAQSSWDSIGANLRSAKNIFTGGTGQGFDDIFIAAGRQTDSDAFIADIDTALASIEAQGSSLFDQLSAINTATGQADCASAADASSTASSPAPCAIYREIKVLSDFMKTTFATVVNLDVPGPVAGDGD